MSEVKVNKVSPRSGTTVTIGDSGDTINIVGTLQNNGAALSGDISSVVAGTGLSGGATSGVATLNIEAAQPTITSLGTLTSATISGDLTVDTNTLFVDASENTVVVGGTDASSWNANADELVVAGASAGGMTFYNPTQTNIFFADGTSGDDLTRGRIQYVHSDNSLRFGTDTSERMRITADGKVQIGTTSEPQNFGTDRKSLTIKSSSSGNYAVLQLSGNASTNDQIHGIVNFYNDTTSVSRMDSIRASSASDAHLRFWTAPSGGGIAERMRITNAGRLGINDSSPDCILNIGANSGITNGDRIRIEDGTYKLDMGVGAASFIQTIGASALKFNTNSTEAMRIHTNQRISMGTTSSGANLEIGATKRTTGQGLESGGICLRNTGTVAGGNILPITARLVNGANARAGIGFVAQTQDGGNAGYAGEIALYTMGSADGASLTNSFERVRLTKAGNFGIGTSTPASKFESILATAGGNYPAFLKHTASSGTTRILRGQMSGHAPNNTDSVFITMGDSTTTRFNVFSNGDVTNSNNSYTGISDIKLKEQIVDASSQWNDIKNIPIKKFKFKTDVATGDSDKHWRLGVIAQEVEEVSPSLVSETTDLDDDHNKLDTVTKSVKYSILYMKAVKALQEAMERIETLETKVTELENS